MRIAAVFILALSFYILINQSSENLIPENKIALAEKEGTKNEGVSESKEIKQVPEKEEKKEKSNTSEEKKNRATAKKGRAKINKKYT